MPPKSTAERLAAIEDAVSRIETALTGDSDMGNPGLVKRVGAVEGKVKVLQHERLKLIGAVTGASTVISLLISFLYGK